MLSLPNKLVSTDGRTWIRIDSKKTKLLRVIKGRKMWITMFANAMKSAGTYKKKKNKLV